MSGTSLAHVAAHNVVPAFTKEERDTLINTIARGATPHELSLFINICQSAQLNPFLNQIYFIKYGDKANVQISVEGIQAIARRREDYDGFTAEVVKENDEFTADVIHAEIVHKVSGFTRGKTVGAYCIARRKGFKPVLVLIGRDETKAMETGNNKTMWNNYYDDMIRKHAIKRALKLQFGIEIGEDESIQSEPASAIPSYQPGQSSSNPIDITPSPKPIEVDEGEQIDPEVELKKAWDEIRRLSEGLSQSEDDLKTYIKEKTNKPFKQLKLPEVIGLRKLMELELASRQKQQSSDLDERLSGEDFDLFAQG